MFGNIFHRIFNYISPTERFNTQRKRSIENDIHEISPIKRARIESSILPSRMDSRDFPDSAFLNTGAVKRSHLNSDRSVKSSMNTNDISRLPTRDDINSLYSNNIINKNKVPVITLEDQENDIEVIENKHPQNFIRKMEPKPFHFGYNGHYSKSLPSQKKEEPFDSTLMVTFDLDEKRRYNKLLSSYLPCNIFRPLHENFSHPQKNSSQKMNKSTKFEVIDLEKNDDVLPKTINVQPAEGSPLKPITLDEEEKSVLTQKLKTLKRLNSFEEKINKTQCFHKNWIMDIEKKFIEKRKEKQKLLQNELERAEILKKHNHKAILKELEERLKRSFSISQLEEITIDDQDVLPELTPKMMEEVKRALVPNPPDQIIVNEFNLRVQRKELHSLHGLNWLNDTVIGFYMELIMERGKSGKFPKCYCFNTFFYSRLIKCGHDGLKRWTKKIDLFSYDIICIPIHLGVHWCMVIVDLRKKFIGFYDSMGSNNDNCLNRIESYLKSENLEKKRNFDMKNWKLENVKKIPQQMNGSDCGVFSCMFAEFLSRDAPLNFSQAEMPYFRNKMVYEILTKKLL